MLSGGLARGRIGLVTLDNVEIRKPPERHRAPKRRCNTKVCERVIGWRRKQSRREPRARYCFGLEQKRPRGLAGGVESAGFVEERKRKAESG